MTLKVASVIGRVFAVQLVAKLHPRSPEQRELADDLRHLVELDLIARVPFGARAEMGRPPYYQFKNESGNHKRFYRVQRTIKHLSAIAPTKSDCSSASSETSSSSGSSINFDSACYHDDTDSCSRTSQAKGRKLSSGHTNMENRGEASLVSRDVYDDDVNTSITPYRKDSSNDERNGRSVSIALTETPSLESAADTFVDDDPSV